MYTVVAVLVLFYFGFEWLLIPALVVIVVWGAYVYRMNVKVLTMPAQTMDVKGLHGTALTDITEEGKVKVQGEIWNATTRKKIKKGEKIKVLRRDGLVLEVEPVEN